MMVAEKWADHLPDTGSMNGDWKRRALRAEAEASAARLMGGLEELLRVAQYKELDAIKRSRSWRMMAPLRALGARLRRRR
jgi:hypothetical protein